MILIIIVRQKLKIKKNISGKSKVNKAPKTVTTHFLILHQKNLIIFREEKFLFFNFGMNH